MFSPRLNVLVGHWLLSLLPPRQNLPAGQGSAAWPAVPKNPGAARQSVICTEPARETVFLGHSCVRTLWEGQYEPGGQMVAASPSSPKKPARACHYFRRHMSSFFMILKYVGSDLGHSDNLPA